MHLYNQAPFELESSSDGLPTEEFSVTLEEAKNLLQFWNSCNIKILGHFTVKSISNDSIQFFKTEGKNFWTKNSRLKDYISRYHGKALLPLPEIFDGYSDLVIFKNNNLFANIIGNLNPDDELQFVDLIEASLQESREILLKLLPLAKKLKLDIIWKEEKGNFIRLNFIKRLLQADQSKLGDIQEKVVFSNRR